FTIHTPVNAIDVTEEIRRYHRMVHRCIKCRLLLFRPPFDLDLVELFIPRVDRLVANEFEIPIRYFSDEILTGILDAYRGKGNLHNNLLVFGGGEPYERFHISSG